MKFKTGYQNKFYNMMIDNYLCMYGAKKHKEKFEREPTKYRKGDDWYTEKEIHCNGQTYSVEDFREKAKRVRSIEASHRRNFPKAS